MLSRREVLWLSASAPMCGILLNQAHASTKTIALAGEIASALPTQDQMWSWEKQLSDWAPCFTGNANHRKYTDWLGKELEMAGVQVQKKSFGITLWDPKKWSLAVHGVDIPVASYHPYSGKTGPEGLTAPMAYAGKMPNIDLSNARGKIVLVDTEVPAPYTNDVGGIDHAIPLWEVETPSQDSLKAAGALACVTMWNGLSEDGSKDQALPFNSPPGLVPALWVSEKTSHRLKEEAAKGSLLHFTLHAEIDVGAKSDNVWGILTGITDDLVIINTHNDGCNAVEENGGLAVVALAQALAKIPKEKRQKTYVFLMTTGHFAHGYHRGSTDWIKEHPDLIKRAVACVTIEHLGATEWLDTGDSYMPTGRAQRSDCYVPTAPMTSIFNDAGLSSDLKRTTAITDHFYFRGEGLQFSAAGVPSIAYIAIPTYLMTAPKGGEISRLSSARLYSETLMFAHCLERLDAMSSEESHIGMDALSAQPRKIVNVGEFPRNGPTIELPASK